VAIGIGAHELGGDLGAVDRAGHDAEAVLEHGHVETGIVEDLGHARIGEKPGEIGRGIGIGRNLHDIGAAVARRQLHHAQPVAVRIETHGLGVDRHLAAIT
jgi:hypothetical protein